MVLIKPKVCAPKCRDAPITITNTSRSHPSLSSCSSLDLHLRRSLLSHCQHLRYSTKTPPSWPRQSGGRRRCRSAGLVVWLHKHVPFNPLDESFDVAAMCPRLKCQLCAYRVGEARSPFVSGISFHHRLDCLLVDKMGLRSRIVYCLLISD
jgi:hypothetical protein